jgi:RHS repeat-associated protein
MAIHASRVLSVPAAILVAAGCLAQSAEPWSGQYAYDGAGNIKVIGGNRFAYDSVGRLRQGTVVTPAQTNVQHYVYDAFGNLLSITVDGSPQEVLASAIDQNTNRATNSSACPPSSSCFAGAFDEAGNQTAFGSTQYLYDTENMVGELSSSSRHSFYIYDTGNQRIATVDYGGPSSQTWHYTLRDQLAQIVREVDDSVSGAAHAISWKKDYVSRAGIMLASVSASPSGERLRHFHLDHLGTPRLITNELGRKVATHTYLPFGRETTGGDADDEEKKFTGHERDKSGDGNDLDYMHARYYSSVAGRFLSVDPSLSIENAVHRPQMWNRYSYVADNPINATDPTGMELIQLGVHDDDQIAQLLKELQKRLRDKSLSDTDRNKINGQMNTLRLEREGNHLVKELLQKLEKKAPGNGLKVGDFVLSTDTRSDFRGANKDAMAKMLNADAFTAQDTRQMYIRTDARSGFYQRAKNGEDDWIIYGASVLYHERVHESGNDCEDDAYTIQKQLLQKYNFHNTALYQTFIKNMDANIKANQ